MTNQERIDNYLRQYKDYPTNLMIGGDGRILGIWMLGNNYRSASAQYWYGSYPAGYLGRVKALFPDKRKPLHLFSGRINTAALPGDTVDLDIELMPTYVDNAQSLEKVPVNNYDIILCDPPYSVEDAEHYQPTMVKRNKVMRRLGELASPGTHIVWLDQVLPMYRKDQWSLEGLIGMVRSTNHRFRVVTIFEKK